MCLRRQAPLPDDPVVSFSSDDDIPALRVSTSPALPSDSAPHRVPDEFTSLRLRVQDLENQLRARDVPPAAGGSARAWFNHLRQFVYESPLPLLEGSGMPPLDVAVILALQETDACCAALGSALETLEARLMCGPSRFDPNAPAVPPAPWITDLRNQVRNLSAMVDTHQRLLNGLAGWIPMFPCPIDPPPDTWAAGTTYRLAVIEATLGGEGSSAASMSVHSRISRLEAQMAALQRSLAAHHDNSSGEPMS